MTPGKRAAYNERMRRYMLRRYTRKKDAIKRLGGRCARCGTTRRLEFDHIDASTKSFTIGQMWSCSERRFLAEIAKCQLLCSRCHRIKTKENGDPRGGGWNRVDNYDHGSGQMYQNDGCRCDDCRTWRRRYSKKEVCYDGSVRSVNRGVVGA